MKAIVHIGTEKTGTTTIQEFLFINRKKLAKSGFHVLEGEGNHNNREVVAYCMHDDKFDDFFQQRGIKTAEQKAEFKANFLTSLRDELGALPRKIHTVILSSEHFHSRTNSRAETDRVRALLSPLFSEIEIVCYLRDQVPTLASFYSTAIKSGSSEAFENFAKRCTPNNLYFNYFNMLKNWEASFGREGLKLSVFDRSHFINGDLLDDFISKLDPALVGKLETDIPSHNESLTFTGQLLGKAINKILPVYTEEGSINEVRIRCQQIIYDECKGKGEQPDRETRQRIYEDFRECNEQLRLAYFPELGEMFPQREYPDEANEVDQEQFADTLSRIMQLIEGKTG